MSVHTSLTYSRQAFLLLRAKTSRQPFGISRSASHSEYCSSIFTSTTYSRVSSSSMGGTLCQPRERGVPERYYASQSLCEALIKIQAWRSGGYAHGGLRLRPAVFVKQLRE